MISAPPAPRRLGAASARLASLRRHRRERSASRAWLAGVALGIALIVIVGGPGRTWYYALRHHRWLQAAQASLDRGDAAAARSSARMVLQRNPVNLRAVQIMTEAASRLGSRDAIYWRSRIVELDPGEPDNLLAWARTALEFGDLPTALIALRRVPEGARDGAAFAQVAADTAEVVGDAEAVARHLAVALALAPDDVGLQLRLAAARLHSRTESVSREGRAVLERLKLDPRCRRPALTALARWALGTGRGSEALAATRELLATGLPDRPTRLLHGEALRAADPSGFKVWLSETEDRAATNPDRTEPAALLQWLGRQGLTNEALTWGLALPAESGKRRPVARSLADLYVQTANWLGLRALTQEPSWAEDEGLRHAYLALSIQRGPTELRRPGQAETLWQHALRLAGSQPNLLEQLARWTVEWRLPFLAERSWWAVVGAADDPVPALVQLAQIYHNRGDIEGRLRVSQQLLAAHPDDRFALAETAYLTLLMGGTDPDPHALVEGLRRRPPMLPEAVRAYALSLWRRHRPAEAATALEMLAITTREEPSMAWFYGVVLAANGEFPRARRFLALGAEAIRCPEEEELYRGALNSLTGH